MKKSDVKDITIRSIGDNKSAGTTQTTGSVEAPGGPTGHLGGAPNVLTSENAPYDNSQIPSSPAPAIRGGSDSALAQPDCPAPAENSLHDSQSSLKVGYPPAANTSGGVSSGGNGLANTVNNGTKVAFPPAADTSMPPKSVNSWM